MDRQRRQLDLYGVTPVHGTAMRISGERGGFTVDVHHDGPGTGTYEARRVLLASGARDVEPDLPGLPDAVRRGLVRYCPICDGFEARGETIGVIGDGARVLGESVFLARTYSRDVTMLTLGRPMDLDAEQQALANRHGVKVVRDPVAELAVQAGRMSALRAGCVRHQFDVVYSALGLERRSEVAAERGAERDETGALRVDEHQLTSVPGLYAVGGVVRGLDQVIVAMGQAAIAATHIHNFCEFPTERNQAEAPG